MISFYSSGKCTARFVVERELMMFLSYRLRVLGGLLAHGYDERQRLNKGQIRSLNSFNCSMSMPLMVVIRLLRKNLPSAHNLGKNSRDTIHTKLIGIYKSEELSRV